MQHPDQILVLAHGWGYDHRFFSPWLTHVNTTTPQALANRLVVCLEAGYFPEQSAQGLWYQDGEHWVWQPTEALHSLVLAHPKARWVGVGHSMGYARLLELSIQWHSLISLHGFSHLARLEPAGPGVAPRVLQAMRNKACTQLPQVLEDFHKQCGLPLNHNTLDHARLLNDLDLLNTLDLRHRHQQLLEQGSQIHAWASRQDRIVPPSLSEACFEQPHWVDAPHAGLALTPAGYTEELLLALA